MAEKFPHFNFFPTDWIAGTAEMTPEQLGAFINLLAYAWEQEPPASLPNNEITLAKWAGLSKQKWKKIGDPIRRRLELGDDGRLRNPKQYRVYLNMCENRKRRKKAGSLGGIAKAERVKNSSNATAMLEENPSKNLASVIRYPVTDIETPSPLRAYLGAMAGAIDRMAASAKHGESWEAGIFALYGPGGTDTEVWKMADTGTRIEPNPGMIAKALDRYAAEGKPYNNLLFRRFLERVINEPPARSGRSARSSADERLLENLSKIENLDLASGGNPP